MNHAYSTLTLYAGVPFDPRFEHSVLFPNKEAQETWFNSRVARMLDNFTYMRKEKSIKVPVSIYDLERMGVNYCRGSNLTGVDHYYFVLDKEYVSEGVTRLRVELDVIQTYQHLWEIPACFVEREHVDDDRLGQNLLDEGLELGEIVHMTGHYFPELLPLYIVIQTSVELQIGGNTIANRGQIFGGVYSGYELYAVPATAEGITKLNEILYSLEAAGKSDGVASMWMYPRALINDGRTDADDVSPRKIIDMHTMELSAGSAVTALDGYTPRNNKLYSYPYCFLYGYNNMGEGAVYQYDQFFDRTPRFIIAGCASNEGVVRLIPVNYRGYNRDYESGLTLSGFPTCAWTQDAYKIWLAQNANSQALAIQSGEIAIGAGVAQMGLGVAAGIANALPLIDTDIDGGSLIGHGMQMAYSGYQQIAGVMAARSDKKVQPPQARGVQSASTNVAIGAQTYSLTNCSITANFAKRIDAFFDMYGYRVNDVKVPNLNSRAVWNYVKTLGCNVLGPIDTNDRRRIGAIFDKGVTLWHNPENMYQYNLASENLAERR